MSYHLIDVMQQLGHPRLLVIGDLILDRYIWGEAERVSQEAPVILLRQESDEMRLGGAANVANMLRGLDAAVTIAGVVGRDSDGEELQASLANAGVDCSTVLIDDSRPTTVKVRFIGKAQSRHPHQILRVDREDLRQKLIFNRCGECVTRLAIDPQDLVRMPALSLTDKSHFDRRGA